MSYLLEVIILTSFILFLCGGFIVWFFLYHGKRMVEHQIKIKQLQLDKSEQLLRDAVQIQETERARIGADIHDDIGPILSALKLKLHRLSDTYHFNDDDSNNTNLLVAESIKSIRKISHNLYPSSLEEHGLFATIENNVGRLLQGTSINIDLKIHDYYETLSEDIKLGLYRISMEFVNNAVKYSESNQIKLLGLANDHQLTWQISENGKGFDVENELGKGMGLKNMEMRSKVINFEFSLVSEKGKGSKLSMIQNK